MFVVDTIFLEVLHLESFLTNHGLSDRRGTIRARDDQLEKRSTSEKMLEERREEKKKKKEKKRRKTNCWGNS